MPPGQNRLCQPSDRRGLPRSLQSEKYILKILRGRELEKQGSLLFKRLKNLRLNLSVLRERGGGWTLLGEDEGSKLGEGKKKT